MCPPVTNVHHFYNSSGKILYLGDGSKRSAENIAMVITTVAGNGSAGYYGDGGPATQAKLYSPYGIAAGSDGSIYFCDTYNHRIRRVDPNDIITTVAGTGENGYSGDSGPTTQSKFNYPWNIVIGYDSSIYIGDSNNHRIRRISSCPPGFTTDMPAIASEDGSEIYQLDINGRHLATLDAITGTVLYTFGYDEDGQFSQHYRSERQCHDHHPFRTSGGDYRSLRATNYFNH